jgi:flagellar secretion chaperone FliS
MFGTARSGANAYAKVGVETGVIAASPHKLIVMLFDGAISSIVTAQMHIKAGNIAGKGQSISKAISIIDDGLRASLDKKVGGEIALSLDSLYEYMSKQLLLANLHNDMKKLDEVQRLLNDLKGAWLAIDPVAQNAAPVLAPTLPMNDPLAPRMAANFAKA